MYSELQYVTLWSDGSWEVLIKKTVLFPAIVSCESGDFDSPTENYPNSIAKDLIQMWESGPVSNESMALAQSATGLYILLATSGTWW